jgi:hypothetical protein
MQWLAAAGMQRLVRKARHHVESGQRPPHFTSHIA